MDIFELQEIFYKDRPVMAAANSDINFLIARLLIEADELKNAPTNHLGLEKHQEQEAVDVILFGLAILRVLGINPEEAIREKLAKNMLKYPPKNFLIGVPFDQGVQASRQAAEETGLDLEFYAPPGL